MELLTGFLYDQDNRDTDETYKERISKRALKNKIMLEKETIKMKMTKHFTEQGRTKKKE